LRSSEVDLVLSVTIKVMV